MFSDLRKTLVLRHVSKGLSGGEIIGERSLNQWRDQIEYQEFVNYFKEWRGTLEANVKHNNKAKHMGCLFTSFSKGSKFVPEKHIDHIVSVWYVRPSYQTDCRF